ncbi:nuclear pore complex-interacting protein family member A5 isoform X1 [Homo sapiens]|uniref:nuclear pore complex-interacting protein family member A5 isoform X1 n=1 Tax=Homo sapiens TaxID=9606 RepID=UPI0023E0235A|nr:nuclear pore complex-interacting protein family member A5 isoform X1 [Homo sapiens]
MRVRWLLFWLLFWLLLGFISHQSTCVSRWVLWLLFWLLLGFISHQSTCVINTLADHRHRGTDFGGSPWLLIITVFLRSYKFAISLCTSYLCVSFLKTIFPSQNGHDGSTDVQQRARRSNCRRQEGIKIVLEDIFTLWRQVETKVRAKIRKMKVTTKVNCHDKINGKRKTAKEHLRKLSMKEREHGEKERQVSEAEENGKLDMKEIHTYMEMFQRARALRRRAEDYYRCKITPSARKPLCNRVRMAAVEHRHSSGLPYWPYLTAETLKNRMGHQPPPPTQQHSIIDNSLSLKTPSERLLYPLPPSADDNLKTPPECLLTPLPPSALPSADDNLKTPAECLLTPLPPSAPPSADDNLKTPPECVCSLPFHPQRMIISRN